MSARSTNRFQPRARPVIVTMSDIKAQTAQWLWPGRIPLGCVSLLIGRPGAGKSYLTCEMASILSRGAEWPAGTGLAPLGDTLLICAEDDPGYTIRPRLDACEAEPNRVHMLTGVSITSEDQEKVVAFTLGNVDIIREALQERANVKLIVIDPIGSYLGGSVDAHRDNEVRSVLSPLARLASESGTAVLLVCHTRKSEASHADDAVLGSRAFTGLARSVLHLMTDREDRNRKLLLAGKSNLGPPAPGLAFRIEGSPARLDWEPDPIADFNADDGLDHNTKSSRGPKPESRCNAKGWLLAQLRAGPLLATEVQRQASESGITERTLRRAAKEMGICKEKTPEGPWIWGLPAQASDSSD
jgi:putative DNA primase/helicase